MLTSLDERICELGAFLIGGGIGYFTGDPTRLVEDSQTLKPNFFPCVPRVLKRIAMGILQAADAPGARGTSPIGKLHRGHSILYRCIAPKSPGG